MSDGERHRLEHRILALGPTGKDAALLRSLLADAGLEFTTCSGTNELEREMQAGIGALLVTEEVILGGALSFLADFVRHQPAWSELPVIILTKRGPDSPAVAQLMDVLGNVTLVERPMRIALLVSALRAALRARSRQYQIREYIAERERIEDSLREADRRKDEFLATLAHELRNPLAPVGSALQLLRRFGGGQSQAQWAQEIIERQLRHLTHLVDDLLDVSRITRGKLTLRKQIVDLGTVVGSAVETSRPLIAASHHELLVDVPSRPVHLHADPVRLAQALSNLLNNAAKYTPDRGRIELRATADNAAVTISVRDSGIGIAPEVLPQVFDLFVQADRGIERAQGGLGIGLTLVKQFTELHGGTIEARSDGPGRGSEFILRLPVLAQDSLPAFAADGEGNARADAAGRRILIVDDNMDGAESLSLLLKIDGNDVHTVFDGPQAIEAVATFRPDVVLLDIGLPTLNGYETARQLRAHPNGREAVIVALTGWGQEEDRRRSREAGFDHHLVKPVDLDALQSLLAARHAH